MRTGVLADSEAKHFFPMDLLTHERHLGVAHIPKHTRTTRKRKQGYRVTPRPRAPYMAHWELAQLMNPDNVRESLPAFETHMAAAMRPRPPHYFKNKVADFKRENPGLLVHDEVAYFFATTGLSPNTYLQGFQKSGTRPLRVIYEEAMGTEAGRHAELTEAYEESMRLLLSEQIPADGRVKTEPTVEVKLEPDGVPSQTDARFERAEAAGREARQEKVNQARNMDGTY